jgi:hypothetical protein
MNMAQRTSSANELKKGTTAGNEESLTKALDDLKMTGKFEFGPADNPTVSLFYLKNQAPAEYGDFYIMDGFYLDSHGGRPAIAVLIHKTSLSGSFSVDLNIPSQITRSGGEVYFLSREMAEYCAKRLVTGEMEFDNLKKTFFAKSYNCTVDHFEDRDQVGHVEDGLIPIIRSEASKAEGGGYVMMGLAEVLVNKKLHLIHVVAKLDSAPISGTLLQLKDRAALINAEYFRSESVAGYTFNERVAGTKPLASLTGRSYEEMIQYLNINTK